MNIKKFKSVAVAIDTYKLLKKIAAADDRSAGMQITYLVKQEAKKRKLTAWKQKHWCLNLIHIENLNKSGSIRKSAAKIVTKNTSPITWWVLKKAVIILLGIVLDVTTCKSQHSLCHDCGVCVVMDHALSLSFICKWLHKEQSVQSRVLYLDVHGNEKGRIMAKKDSLRTRLLREYVKMSKTAPREAKTWKEVATRVRWERLRKILWRRYDYMQSL